MSDTTIGVRLDEPTKLRLKLLADKRDRTPHYLMKEALQKFLELEEAKEAELDIVKARWSCFEITGEVIQSDEMRKWAQGLGNS